MNSKASHLLSLLRIAAISPELRVGNVPYNVKQITSWMERMADQQVAIALFPEMCLTGYTIADAVRWPSVLDAAASGLQSIADFTAHTPTVAVVGLPVAVGAAIYNCAAVVSNGSICGLVPKTYLPASQEFYDMRWFTSGNSAIAQYIEMHGKSIPFGTDLLFTGANRASCILGIEICEDLWAVEPPSGRLALAGATVILNLSASNELVGKGAYRRGLVTSQSARCFSGYAYASAGPTESTADTVFSSHCIISECGELIVESERLAITGTYAVADIDLERITAERRRATTFGRHVSPAALRHIPLQMGQNKPDSVLRTVKSNPFIPNSTKEINERCNEVLHIQATALAARMHTVGIKRLVLGISGGLDSTWALIVCREACAKLGYPSTSVVTISMPGLGTTNRTSNNAQLLAECFGTELLTISIRQAVLQHFESISHNPENHNIVYENAQARERTQILMDVANQVDGMVVGTADLSETALGWCTYNADHMSMYGVNSGVPKTLIRSLVHWYATTHATERTTQVLLDVLETPISPELLPTDNEDRSGHLTEEELGPYEVHDFFLYHLLRLERSVTSTAALAMIAFESKYTEMQILEWLSIFIRRFWTSQFKRNAQPDGVKVGSIGLSARTDWRMASDGSYQAQNLELERLRAIFT